MSQQYKNILVPVDGSKTAEVALTKAAEIAIRNNAHLDILNVIDMRQFTPGFGLGIGGVDGDVIYDSFEDTNDYLLELQQKVKDLGCKDVSVHARFGSPRTVISTDFPKDHNTDLIVMGPTGTNAVTRLFVGAVTDYVIRAAQCDVIVAR